MFTTIRTTTLMTTDYLSDAITFAEAIRAEADDAGILRVDPFSSDLDAIYARTGLPVSRRSAVTHVLRRDGFLVDHEPDGPQNAFTACYRLTGIPEAAPLPETVESPVGQDSPPGSTTPAAEPSGSEPPPRKRTKSSTKALPAQVPWKEPKDQGDHMRAIRDSRTLKKNPRFVAMEAHVQLGLTSVVEHTLFPDVRRELTEGYLAMFTGLSDKTVRSAMAEACRLGFYQRVDDRNGGRGNTNRATYRATVPVFHSKGETVTG